MTRVKRSSALFAVLAAAVLTLAGCSSSSSSPAKPAELNPNAGSGPFQGSGLTPAQPRPSFTLSDTAGKQFSFGTTTKGHPTLLYFGYTNCPDVCPTTMVDIQHALQKVPAAVAKKTYVVFISTDVKHDTAPIIKQWLSNFSVGTTATWVGLRGTQTQIDAAQAAAHITVAEDGGETHSAEALLYGPDDYAHVFFLQSDELSQQVTHDLPLIADGKS